MNSNLLLLSLISVFLSFTELAYPKSALYEYTIELVSSQSNLTKIK